MFCCGKDRDDKYCSDCGAELIADTAKRNLAEYLDKQARTVRKNLENRLKLNPEMSEHTAHHWNEKIKKWEEWRDWVITADGEAKHREE